MTSSARLTCWDGRTSTNSNAPRSPDNPPVPWGGVAGCSHGSRYVRRVDSDDRGSLSLPVRIEPPASLRPAPCVCSLAALLFWDRPRHVGRLALRRVRDRCSRVHQDGSRPRRVVVDPDPSHGSPDPGHSVPPQGEEVHLVHRHNGGTGMDGRAGGVLHQQGSSRHRDTPAVAARRRIQSGVCRLRHGALPPRGLVLRSPRSGVSGRRKTGPVRSDIREEQIIKLVGTAALAVVAGRPDIDEVPCS